MSKKEAGIVMEKAELSFPAMFPSIPSQLTPAEGVTGSEVNTEQSLERPNGITIQVLKLKI